VQLPGEPRNSDLVIIEGAGAARRELRPMVDTVIWVQSDLAEAERRGIERDGGDDAAIAFWHLWMAEELPFMAHQQPWTRADIIIAGTPTIPHNPVTEVVIAQPQQRPSPGGPWFCPSGLTDHRNDDGVSSQRRGAPGKEIAEDMEAPERRTTL